jgi:dipeptidyl aminopeptidase/acylaminoacyl peptidase
VATVAPYGSWSSPISAEQIARQGVRLGETWLGEDGSAYWVEGRPSEGGRSVLVRQRAGGGPATDLVPEEFNVRTRVHEYGGGAWLLAGELAFCSNFADQRLYRVEPGAEPRAITPEPPERGSIRYADGREVGERGLLACVRESHADGQVVNELITLAADGSAEPRSLASGRDFYSNPRPSPDGSRLAWLEWDHPRMPWDGTEMRVADLSPDGTVGDSRLVAGGPSESIWQPEWSPGGELHYVSDRSGWWLIYRESGEAVVDDEADYGYPQWLFGGSTYAFTGGGEVICIRTQRATERLCRIRGRTVEELDLPYTAFGWPTLRTAGDDAIFVAASPETGPAVVRLDLERGTATELRRSAEAEPEPGYVSRPRAIEFATDGGRTAHGFHYPPANPEFEGPPGELPPLIVEIHGGPTSHARPELGLDFLYWTSRGFAVVDVNYGGSTGFGREYRERLNGTWGIVDTADCIAAARHLADAGEVDGRRLAIRGGSAGGYTTLCALVFHDLFDAGASYYGVADAETLAQDTHKFESRYLDTLIGPYPAERERYRERSPIHFLDQLRSPVLLLQGLEDKVVPPAQAEQIVAELRERGIPHAYVSFEGEQHGFRRAESIIRAHEAELYFYGRVLGFEPADEIEPVEIPGLTALSGR